METCSKNPGINIKTPTKPSSSWLGSLSSSNFSMGDGLLQAFLLSSTFVSLATTAGIVVIIGGEAFLFFQQIPWQDFLTGTKWQPLINPSSYGVLPLVAGSLQVVLLATTIALPMGVTIAAHLNASTRCGFRSLVKPLLEILAGIPTVVYGFFALTTITPFLNRFFPSLEVFNAASAGIVVGIMILPMVSSLCDDAFSAISRGVQEGAFALGATRFEVLRDHIIPGAYPRIVAATILALSRALGETMAVTLAAGATPNLDFSYMQSIQTMTAYIVEVSLGDIPTGGLEHLTCYGVAALLFVLTFTLNLIGRQAMEVPRSQM